MSNLTQIKHTEGHYKVLNGYKPTDVWYSVNIAAGMWSIFGLGVLISTAYGASIGDDKGAELYGDYKLIYVWPKTSQYIPNCTPTSYKPITERLGHLSCECGRANFNIAVLKQDTKYIGKSILFDIIKSDDESTAAVDDICTCEEPLNYLSRVVVLKLSDNLMLQYEKEDILRHYIFGKEIPSETELRAAIANVKNLKYEDGQWACE